MSELKKFQVQTARPLPIIVLADTSGSMSVDGKIEALNKGLKDMISSFAGESRLRAEIQVSVITFGGSLAELNLPLTRPTNCKVSHRWWQRA
ncbi:vWA domain-containing protein [Pseudomonas aeruginosa]